MFKNLYLFIRLIK